MPQIIDKPALIDALGVVGFLILMGLVLAAMVSAQRRAAHVSLGDGGDAVLLRRIRAHGNFTEVAPFVMIGLIGLAMSGSSGITVLVLGGLFILARIAHAVGLYGSDGRSPGRLIGVLVSWVVLAVIGVKLLALLLLA
ncbi:MAG: MAPEG family protein [Hyphomicrobiales bacterium]|nr:MAPEG family protein [Hyphomicrobiales bacterium]MDE2114599.1 MAPEG family protein [Hyphomicrobiales bacterium]